MDLDFPVQGLEELAPLAAYVVLYLVILVVLRLFVWPFLLAIKARGFLPRLLRRLSIFAVRLFFFGLLLLGAAWALASLGWLGAVSDALAGLPDLDVPGIDLTIPGALLLLLLLLLIVLFPVLRLRR